MDRNEQIFETLEKFNLNWSVLKEPLISSVDGAKTDSYGLFKSKNRMHLATVGSQYEPYQNASMVEAMLIATENLGLNITNGGTLDGGRKVYLQAELPAQFIGKSEIKRQITNLNGHGGISAGFGSSNTVVICENTFFMAYGDLQKVRHTSSIKERIEALAKALNETIIRDNKLMENFKVMAETPLTESLIQKAIRTMFDVEAEAKKSDVSARKFNQIETFAKDVEKEIVLEGNTVWGLWNGVTRYLNHSVNHVNDAAKKDFLYTGRGFELSNKNLNMLFEELGISEKKSKKSQILVP